MHGNMNVSSQSKSVHKCFDKITNTTAEKHKIKYALVKCGYLLLFLAGLCLKAPHA